MSYRIASLPQQLLSFKLKTKKWRKNNMDYFDSFSLEFNPAVRSSVHHKKINFDLLDGILHMNDLERIINPDGIQAEFIPERILHYPIINAKLNVLRGEEAKRVFDYKVIVTNPNSISEIEETKKLAIFEELQALMLTSSLSEEEFNLKLEKLNKYFTYEYLDLREIRANALLNHYNKELNFPLKFNSGFFYATAVAEEIYQCEIVANQPVLELLDPRKVTVIRSGYSNRIEDADAIVIEDYWSPGRINDYYYDSLTDSDRKYINNLEYKTESAYQEDMGTHPSDGFVRVELVESLPDNPVDYLFGNFTLDSKAPYDSQGNIKVLRAYWKSRRKIKLIKSYDPETGEETFTFYPETYIANKAMGEEEKVFWVNEAWEGTKIGKNIYVNIRPRPIQYNTIDNPSKCHFGIIGSLYTVGGSHSYSLVDMMKPYSYLYDVIHDRLNKLIAHNYGKLVELDLAKKPTEWSVEKWLYFAKVNNLAVVDSFNEGLYGAATGKLAGGLNNASRGVIDADLGNTILLYMNLLEFIKSEMSDVAGISRQREGLISNRETVGGVERATLLSSHITEWLFTIHDDVKKRVLECFVETAKIAIKTGSLKFLSILPDFSRGFNNVEGDEFAESDYGLVVDNSNSLLELSSKLDSLVLAGLQTQAINFSTALKIYLSCSLAEKIRMIVDNEEQMMLLHQLEMLQQLLMQEQLLEAAAALEQMKMEHESEMNAADNETKVIVAEIAAASKANDGIQAPETEFDRQKLLLLMRLLDEKMSLDRDKLAHQIDFDNKTLEFLKAKATKDQELKARLIVKQRTSTSK